MSKCIVCREREAAVPDRNRLGPHVNRVCRQCHQARLMRDIARVIEHERKRKADCPRRGE